MSKKNIEEIVSEKLPTFVSMIKDMESKEELNKTLVLYLRDKEKLLIARERDEQLHNLKIRKAEISKPYNQTISALKKMQSCIYKFGHKFEDDLKSEFEKNLIAYARQLSEIKRAKDENDELQSINDLIKEINDDYNPALKELEMRCEYVSFVLKERFESDVPQVEI